MAADNKTIVRGKFYENQGYYKKGCVYKSENTFSMLKNAFGNDFKTEIFVSFIIYIYYIYHIPV